MFEIKRRSGLKPGELAKLSHQINRLILMEGGSIDLIRTIH